jgi:hypothetical protein
MWPLLQQTLAAMVAWIVAKGVIDHHDPFFAPIAAVVALNTSFGQRGSNALRLLQGVVVGIVIGELTLATLGSGYGGLALALFVAMAIARATGGTPITVAQAAVGAILTVAVGNQETGIERLTDALIGAGVALVFTQLLFAPEPLTLLRRAETAVLTEMAKGLRLAAQALADGDDQTPRQALDALPTLREHLAELAGVRHVSISVARHSVRWRRRMPQVGRETENAGDLGLLGDCCLMLIRTAVAERGGSDRGWLSPHVQDLAGTLSGLAQNPDDLTTRQRAVSGSLEMARQLAHDLTVHESPAAGSPLEATVILTRIAAADIMIFCGVDPGQAAEAGVCGN